MIRGRLFRARERLSFASFARGSASALASFARGSASALA